MTTYHHSRYRSPACAAALLLAVAAWGLPCLAAARPDAPDPDAVDFTRDVRPILSNRCFKCHGPDEKTRKGDLRLDIREEAVQPAESGAAAIVPGDTESSELVYRISTDDEDDLMPPPDAKMELTAREKEILTRWVEQGAEYREHWAWAKPEKQTPPEVSDPAWPRNAIDHFVMARLDQAGLRPSPEADRHQLLRRLHLDLIGIPPTPDEIDRFVNDASRDAYERAVDRLLASPRYGERWARVWLDLARYADTNGYEKDRARSIWPFRDWVISALNADMPFDRFTIEQIAGDMLPDATVAQKVATGFHRNTMLNEEGGIDPLEFRYHAMNDRVATTGATWLGLTLQCAQCHTHKYDPIPHREYFELMAFLNNADEVEIPLPDPEIERRRQEQLADIENRIAALPAHFPAPDPGWSVATMAEAASESGEAPVIGDDQSAAFPAPGPDMDTYTLMVRPGDAAITRIRIEALADPSLPGGGPGRTSHGNFVLSEVHAEFAAGKAGEPGEPLRFSGASAEVAQPGFPAQAAVDGDLATGWAIHDPAQPLNGDRTLILTLLKPAEPRGRDLVVRLVQAHGSHHTIGRVRVSVDAPGEDGRPIEDVRRELFEARFAEWLEHERSRQVAWTTIVPHEAVSNLPLLTVQDDGSVFCSGDISKDDTYELRFRTDLRGITAIRLEALPDERLPAHGPGMTYYEGPKGDFFMGEFGAATGGAPIAISGADESYAKNAFGSNPVSAALCLDGDPQTGWSTNGREGERHVAVFRAAEPVDPADGELSVTMRFGRHYACSLGRFRISVSTDPRAATASDLPPEIAALLELDDESLTEGQRGLLRREFSLRTPELAAAREEIERLRKLPPFPTTLAFRERPPQNPRPTFIHHRGEYLQAEAEVLPSVFSFLHPLPAGAPRNRLGFARWLVSPDNPLTARVTVNRQWERIFGIGIVRTSEDFGFQGETPSHPGLLDWLAVDFMENGWSLKRLHRQIVTSATYRQDSRTTDDLQAADPENRLLARGPRLRLEAELIRDAFLGAAGILSDRIGGPSVFPPQPPGVTTEGTYGALAWTPSQGEDRYRRGLYTYSKRTAPFAMAGTFDAPSGEACVARRDSTNTPLQALTLLNDVAVTEAAALLGRTLAAAPGSDAEKIGQLFLRALGRPPDDSESAMVAAFLARQRERIQDGTLDAARIAGGAPEQDAPADRNEAAAWAVTVRAIFNLDEFVTKT